MDYILPFLPVVLAIPVVAIYFKKIVNLIFQVGELLMKVTEVLGDNQVTAEEIEIIKKEAKDVVDAIKAFGAK